MMTTTTFTAPQIKTLHDATVAEITAAFNAAFADYKIKLQLTETDMRTKIKAEGIALQHSVGAYLDGRLVSFILHGVDDAGGRLRVYNAGTGTLPAYRGRGLAQQLYRFAIALLQQRGVRHHQLEVFDDNHAALKVYTDNGFKITRKLACYRGTVQQGLLPKGAVVESMEPDRAVFENFWSYTPTWQNDFGAIGRNLEAHKVIGIKYEDRLVGYAIYLAGAGRLRQLAVHPAFRRQGFGTALMSYIGQDCSGNNLLVTNVEEDAATDRFFVHLGFDRFLNLYEMHLDAAAGQGAAF